MLLTGRGPIADPRLEKEIHVSATCGYWGNQSVLKWAEVVLEMTLVGRMFLTDEEPYSQTVLSKAMEGIKHRSL